ncbi:hypothetical protein JCM3775_003188 [Rhodotorula graminis]
MATADPALSALPHCERDADTIDAALHRIAQLKSHHRVKHLGTEGRRHQHGPNFELIGDKLSLDHDKDEVDDSFFTLDRDDSHKVRLKIANVPRRAGTRIKRTLRGKPRKGAPGIVIEEADDDAAFDLDDGDDGRTTAPSTAPSSLNGDLKPRLTPTSSSQDSLVSLELPTFAPLVPSSSSSTRPPALSQPSFSTLTALRTVTSTASSSPPASTFTPDPPSRRLTIDDNIAPVIRRDTFASLHHAASKRGLHLPGRPHFARRHHKGAATSAAAAAASATAEALGLDEQVAQALKDAGVLVAEEDRVVVDVLYEHQRGLVVFGLPKFSSNLLFQVDPPQWCDNDLKPSAFTPHTYPLPPYWVWRDSEFMVDMGGDKDEEGWSYALRFRSRFWRGEAYTMRSFVRRRRWIRTRVYRPQHLPLLAAAQSQQNALDSMGPPPPPAYDPSDTRTIADLHTACAALPLPAAERAALLTESASPLSYLTNVVPPSNPFLSYRALKVQAASSGALPVTERASAHEPRWRDAVRELNWRRATGVVRAHAKIDRQRLELWRLWLGARSTAPSASEGERRGRGSSAGEGGRGVGTGAGAGAREAVRMEAAEGAAKGAGEAGKKAISAAACVAEEKERTEVWEDVDAHDGGSRPDVQDVWDVIEGRLDDILASFDYHYTRILFLELLLSLHPTHDASHRSAGYDVPDGAPQRLERGLVDRLAFFDGVKDLVAHYGAQGGWLGAKVETLEGGTSAGGKDKERETTTGKAKGKRRA